MNIPNTIEALLFAEGGPLSRKKLASMLSTTETVVAEALSVVSENLRGRGLTLIVTDNEVALAVAPEARDVVAEVLAKEQDRDVGDAGLEILAILLYEGPSTRATIDYIRGVNSSSTIRTLVSRGLVERTGNPLDGREYIYRPTVDLLAHLGVSSSSDLPDFATIAQELTTFKQSNTDVFHGNSTTT